MLAGRYLDDLPAAGVKVPQTLDPLSWVHIREARETGWIAKGENRT